MDSNNLLPALRLATIGTSAFLSGYITSFSYLGIPIIRSAHPLSSLVHQWRTLYTIGAHSAPYLAALCSTSFSFLAYQSRKHQGSSLVATPAVLYSAAAVMNIVIAPYTVLAMRPGVNDELMAMAERADGGAEGKEVGSAERVGALLGVWTGMNYVRAGMVALGAAVGGAAVLIESLH